MKSIELYQEDSAMENELRNVYREYWPRLMRAIPELTEDELKQLANPFLVKVLPGYRKAAKKVLFVGQETGGWDSFPITLETYPSQDFVKGREEIISYLQWMYEDLRFQRKWDYTPFWKGARRIYKMINGESEDNGFMHTELVRFDMANTRPPHHIEELLQREFNVLPGELQALKPDVVIFLTGPDYDERLKKTYDGTCDGESVQIERIDGFGENQLVRVIHPLLPFHTYRTYHPGYSLRYPEKVFMQVAEKIGQLVP